MRGLSKFLRTCVFGAVLLLGCSDTTSGGGTNGSTGGPFPCTEQGLRDAIAIGGGPHTFSCDAPVSTRAAIVINNDVILDGEGTLTIDAQEDHRVFLVISGVTAELRRLTVTEGFAGILGGGGILNRGELTLADVTVTGNRGGGIVNEGTLSVADGTISANTASSPSDPAGGLGNSGTATLTNTKVTRNGARFVGGGIVNAGTLVLTSSSVSENRTESNGGGIINAGTLTMDGCAVSGNTTESGEGGGIANTGALTLVNSTVSGNAAYSGGGLSNNGDPSSTSLLMTNSTVSGNTAKSEGGGLYNELASATLINCTLSENAAANGSAIFSRYQDSTTVLERTVVDGQCAFDSAELTSNGHNIESTGDTCGLSQETDRPNESAEALRLGRLRNNGGLTETHALAHDSIGIDAVPSAACVDADGERLATDQRGVERPQGETCDVGAFELDDCASAQECDDFNDCTESACKPEGLCDYPLAPNGTSCDDEGTPGTCSDGNCIHPFQPR